MLPLWGATFAATLLLSRPLWLSARDYPLVPLVPGLPQPPAALSALLFLAALSALGAAAFRFQARRAIQAVLAISALWLVLDQTRWQPYVLTFVVAGVCLLRAEGEAGLEALAPLQLALALTYAHSGAHKLNHEYLLAGFGAIARPLLDGLGVPAGSGWVRGAALLSACVELAFGLMLLWPRTRRAGVVGLTAMHVFILGMLAQLSTRNSVVWAWNVFSIGALWLLFWPRAGGARLDGAMRTAFEGRFGRSGAGAVWWAVLFLFGVAPALSYAGLWDASLSFQLYAAKERTAVVAYYPSSTAQLPHAARAAVVIDGQLDLAIWAMRELNVTPVLAPRVVREIGRPLARRAPEAGVRMILGSPPALRTGTRSYQTWVYDGPDATPVLVHP